jgi:hypothetical protein
MGRTHRFVLAALLAGVALALLVALGAAVAGNPPGAGDPSGAGSRPKSGAPPAAGRPSIARPVGDQLLVRVATTDRATLASIYDHLQPVRIIDGLALAWAQADAVEAARQAGVAVDILGIRRPDRDYAVVYLSADRAGGRPGVTGARDRLAGLGRTLWSDERRAVLEYPATERNALCAAFEILPILDRPVVWPGVSGQATAGDLPPRPVAADPTVQGFVGAVSADSLIAVVSYLQDLGSRRSYEPGCAVAADSLSGMLRRHGISDVSRFDYMPEWPGDVVGVQRGVASPDEWYVICGHYDSFSAGPTAPGADDNGTGTAAVMEAARILGRQQFEATIVYLAVSGEEQGLIGSDRWVRQALTRGRDIRGAINLDMIGWRDPSDPPDLDLISDDNSSGLNDFIVAAGSLYLPGYSIVSGMFGGGNSDQQSFWDGGYRSVTFFEDTETRNPYYHTSNDIVGPSVNDPEFLRHNVQVAVATLAELARPVAVHLAHVPLEDPAATAASYPVRVRIVSPTPLVPDSVRLRFRVNSGDFAALPLLPADSPGVYAADIPRQEPGDLVEYYTEARDTGGRRATEPAGAPREVHSFMVGRAVVFFDGFAEDRGWTVGSPGDSAVSGRWIRANPVGTRAQPESDFDGDSLCFVTGNGVAGGGAGDADVDGGRTTLTSPPLDLDRAAAADLTFAYWFFNEALPDDSLCVLISNDDGAAWTELQALREPQAAWRLSYHARLESLLPLTATMRFRFTVADLGRPSLLEAAIDAVKLRAVIPPAPPPPTTTSLVAPSPQPFHGSVEIRYDLSRGADVDLAVYDAGGRRVAELVHAFRRAGSYPVSWDGRRVDGRPLPSGVYFLRLDAGGRVFTRRIVRVR